jgi:hypothetical protein
MEIDKVKAAEYELKYQEAFQNVITGEKASKESILAAAVAMTRVLVTLLIVVSREDEAAALDLLSTLINKTVQQRKQAIQNEKEEEANQAEEKE